MAKARPDPKKILVVEDDDAILTALRGDLKFEGFAVTAARDGRSGYELATSSDFDLIILDILLPRMDGFEICRKVRQQGISVPILMLTAAKTDETDKVTGLELGADDYVTKPFGMRELMARIKALLRRGPSVSSSGRLSFGTIEIDLKRQEVKKAGRAVHLTAREFNILRLLVERRGEVVTRDEILDAVWDDVFVAPRSVDPHIARLRRKLEDDPSRPRLILGIRSVGYKLGDH
jgi:DNA-binding response OmpR family regulator